MHTAETCALYITHLSAFLPKLPAIQHLHHLLQMVNITSYFKVAGNNSLVFLNYVKVSKYYRLFSQQGSYTCIEALV